MPNVPLLTGEHVRAAVSPSEAVDVVRDAFLAYARGEWTMPPKTYVEAYPAGDFRAMPALGGGYALLKWVTSFPGNPARGLPTVTGLVLLSSAGYTTALGVTTGGGIAVPGLDLDGDGRSDVAVYHGSHWSIWTSSSGFASVRSPISPITIR